MKKYVKMPARDMTSRKCLSQEGNQIMERRDTSKTLMPWIKSF